MPHLILQTKLAAQHSGAEVSFYGPIEREAMEALQACTFAALQTSWDGQSTPVAFWRPSPYSPHVVQFLLNIPGGWECRRTLHNVLRVSWLDVLEQYGWIVRSAWNSDKTTVFPPPEQNAEARPADAKDAPGDFKGECANFLLSKGDMVTKISGGMGQAVPLGVHADTPGSSEAGDKADFEPQPRGGGLTLPDCVQALLSEPSILRWDPVNRHYQVLDGTRFEERFNQLRRVRTKHKDGAVERPFSRMHNFFILERGDKWAKTGSLFKPKSPSYYPKGYQAYGPPVVTLAHVAGAAATAGVLTATPAAAAAAAALPGTTLPNLEFSATAIQALSVQPIPAARPPPAG